MNSKVFVVLLVLAIGVFAGCAAQQEPQQPPEAPTEEQPTTPPAEQPSEPEETPAPEGESEASQPDVTLRFTGESRVFIHEGERNPTVTVQEGDLVRIEYETTSGLHDWVIDEFGATAQVGASEGVQVLEFVADQAGEFEYYCSVGSHRQQGMFGTFIVE